MAQGRNATPLTRQGDDFSAWYNEVAARAELVDRGPVKGTMIMRPYGNRIWELLRDSLDARIRDTGHDNVYFPLLIPESYLQREKEHVDGFAPELAVVTVAGGKQLDEPLVIRPTSETIIGEAMARWISSYRDLPMLLNQWANVVRWELRPRVFLRTTEFLWQEGHTAHATEADAMAETMLALGFYGEVARDIAAMSFVPGEKTAGERFAGAQRTFSLEAMMLDGRALQAATSHFMGTNFATAFDITYTDADGQLVHAHTTSWGMSTRMIGGIIMSHGDDKGLIIPPRVAPHQVVLIPLGRDDAALETTAAARRIAAELKAVGVRAHVDERSHLRPGYRFADWELKGVPLRLEVGARELAEGTVTLVSRLAGRDEGKRPVATAELTTVLPRLLDEFHDELCARADRFREDHTQQTDDWGSFREAVATGWAVALHCGQPDCEDAIKAETRATARCVPLDGEPAEGTCVRCDRPSAYGKRVIFARAY